MSTAKIPPAELLYLKTHINDNLKPNLIACIVVCGLLAYIAVALRFVSRRVARLGYGADDWMITSGLFLYTFYFSLVAASVHYGLGKHINAVPTSSIYSFALVELISTSVYGLAIMAVKLAILLLYLRIFPFGLSRPITYAAGALVVAIGIMNFFGNIFKCVPVSASLDASPMATAKCINYLAFAGTMQGLNILTDLIVLLLPIPTIWRLQMDKKKKLLVIGTLAMGSGAVIVSIVRLAIGLATVISVDLTWIEVPPITSSLVEISVGIIAGCLPTYRPLLRRGTIEENTSTRSRVSAKTLVGGDSPKVIQEVNHTEKATRSTSDEHSTGSIPSVRQSDSIPTSNETLAIPPSTSTIPDEPPRIQTRLADPNAETKRESEQLGEFWENRYGLEPV